MIDFRKSLSGSRGPSEALTVSIAAAARARSYTPQRQSGIYSGRGPSADQGEVLISRDPNAAPFTGANKLLFTSQARMLPNVRLVVDSGVTLVYMLPSDGQILNWDSVAQVSIVLGDQKYGRYRFDGSSLGTKANRCRFINLGDVQFWAIEELESLQKLGPKGSIVAGAAVFPFHGALNHCPRDGYIRGHRNSGSPSGYGPNQIASAQRVSVGDVDSDGGTALRLETDGNACGVHDLKADKITARNGNRVLAMSAHDVDSDNVVVTNLKGTSMFDGIRLASGTGGRFIKTKITTGSFAYGTHAQDPAAGGVAGNNPSHSVLSMSGGHDVVVHGVSYTGFTQKNRGEYKNPDGSPVYV